MAHDISVIGLGTLDVLSCPGNSIRECGNGERSVQHERGGPAAQIATDPGLDAVIISREETLERTRTFRRQILKNQL